MRGIVDAVQSVGDEDQIALALMGALEHPEIRPYMGRIVGSFNTEAAKVGLRAVDGMKSLVDLLAGKRATGGRSKQCRALLIAIAMCVTHELDDKVSKEAVIRQIFPAISRAAAQRLLKTAGKKRKRLEEEELYDFRMVDEERKRWKYTDEIILNLRHYMCNNIYTRDSPNSKDTIRERDMYGKCTIHSSLSYPKLISGLIVYFHSYKLCSDHLIKTGAVNDEGKPKYKEIRVILISICPRELHVLMCKPVSKGGYSGAHDGKGNVMFSEMTLRHYWPNYLKVMTEADILVCGCETCITSDDLHDAYVAKRRRIISASEATLEEMDDDGEAVPRLPRLNMRRHWMNTRRLF